MHFGYQMCSWGRESTVGSFAARSSAPLRSLPSATACTSSMQSTQRWSPALWTPSLLIWPGKQDCYTTPNQLPVMNITSKFPPIQDQYAQKTGRTWTNENPSAVRSDSSDFKRLWSVSGGPRTHTEVWFPIYKIYRNNFFWEGLMGLKWNCLMDRVTYCELCA